MVDNFLTSLRDEQNELPTLNTKQMKGYRIPFNPWVRILAQKDLPIIRRSSTIKYSRESPRKYLVKPSV